MKTLILSLLLSTNLYAKTITQDGQDYTCSPKKTCDQQLKEAKAQIKKLKQALADKQVQVVEKEVQHKNIISLYGVNSQSGLTSSRSGNTITVETKREFGIGALYQRKITEQGYLGLGVDTNSGVIVSVGAGF